MQVVREVASLKQYFFQKYCFFCYFFVKLIYIPKKICMINKQNCIKFFFSKCKCYFALQLNIQLCKCFWLIYFIKDLIYFKRRGVVLTSSFAIFCIFNLFANSSPYMNVNISYGVLSPKFSLGVEFICENIKFNFSCVR